MIKVRERFNRAVLGELLNRGGREVLRPLPLPSTRRELLEGLGPMAARDRDGFLMGGLSGVFANLGSSAQRSLMDLADSLRDAETPEEEHRASEGLRMALLGFGFDGGWVDTVLPSRKKPDQRVKAKLPEAGPPRYGEPRSHQYHESWCRFFSTPEGEPDGNQGGFTD